MKVYEELQQNQGKAGDGGTQMAGSTGIGGLDFFGGQDDQMSAKKDEQASALGQSVGGGGSPQKSLAIKGPQKIISEKLEIEDYQGVKVTDINVRPINQSVAHIRA